VRTLILTAAFLVVGPAARAVAEGPRTRADQPPRKVIVGTVVRGPWNRPPALADRLAQLEVLVDRMAERAARDYPGRRLDLAILPETAVTLGSDDLATRAVPLEGPVKETFRNLARKHQAYIIATLDMAEPGPDGTTYSNAAVLFDRRGEVAGIYRKIHPVALLGSDVLEGGIAPGREVPVFDCDFGRLGIQICWDMVYADGWEGLARQGAEIVAWPSASPATAQPASRAGRHRYYIVSSTWRDNATVFEPTGLVAARVESADEVLVHQLDLSYAVLGWSTPLRNGAILTEKYGDRVGYHYEPREDLGLFWSNDPAMSIGEMIRSVGLEEIDAQIERNRKLQDTARGEPLAPG
jgi:predicted amidohydrolase